MLRAFHENHDHILKSHLSTLEAHTTNSSWLL